MYEGVTVNKKKLFTIETWKSRKRKNPKSAGFSTSWAWLFLTELLIFLQHLSFFPDFFSFFSDFFPILINSFDPEHHGLPTRPWVLWIHAFSVHYTQTATFWWIGIIIESAKSCICITQIQDDCMRSTYCIIYFLCGPSFSTLKRFWKPPADCLITKNILR